MTYEERIETVCKECEQHKICGYQLRNLQVKCDYLTNVGYGWKLGQQDTLEAIEECIDKGNSKATEEFMKGLNGYLNDK
jgi:hypothetical protein